MPNDRLRDALLRHGLTPEELARRLGVDPKTAERWITQARTPYPKNRHEIAALVRESESYLWPDALSADRAAEVAESEVVQLFPHRASVPHDLWIRLIGGATEEIGILVYSALFLPEQNPGLTRTLAAKANNGAKVRLLFGHPGSREITRRSTEEGIGGSAIAAKIRNVLAFYRPLADVAGVEVRQHRTTLYNSIYRFDDDMLVNTHVYGYNAATAPVLHLRRLSGGTLFDTYADSFEKVWTASKPVNW